MLEELSGLTTDITWNPNVEFTYDFQLPTQIPNPSTIRDYTKSVPELRFIFFKYNV